MNDNLIIKNTPEITSNIKNVEISDTKIDFEDSKNIDIVFDNYIKNKLSEKQYTNIFIPLNTGLSNLDFFGINLALHIRFTSGKNQLSNIFIYGISDFEFISKHNLLAGSLLTKGIKLIDYSLEEIEKHLEATQKLNDIDELKDELKKINIVNHIQQNEIYNSNNTDSHAVANIWGALRFADLTGLNEAIKDNEQLQELKTDLYYKYITTISSETEKGNTNQNKITISKTNKNILYIDDNANQGWGDLLKAFFEDDIVVIGKEKSEKHPEFIARSKEKIELGNWHLILLDFRLNPEEDKNQREITKISGAKMLEHIKKINAGIQVIMFTATNKSWNINSLLKIGANGYYYKESIENSNNVTNSKININSLTNNVKKCIKNSYLIEIKDTINEIEDHLETINNKIYKPIPRYLDLFYKTLCNSNIIEWAPSYIYLFNIIELIINEKICEVYNYDSRETKTFFKKDNSELKNIAFNYKGEIISENSLPKGKKISLKNKIYNLIKNYSYELKDLLMVGEDSLIEIEKLILLRNNYIHQTSSKKLKTKSVQKADVLNMFLLIKKITLRLE